MATRKLLSFNALSDQISKKILDTDPSISVKTASAMGHDLARAVLRRFFNGGEVPTHFDIDPEHVTGIAQLCREGLRYV